MRPSHARAPLFIALLTACSLLVVATSHDATAAPGINLSWNDCGAAGSEVKTFACDRNGGSPFTLVGSFQPPAGMTDVLGLSAEMWIHGAELPNWWKHGQGSCRGVTGLSTSFDFTSNTVCADFMYGNGVGGFAYDVEFGGPTNARLRLQAAVPIDSRTPLSTDTEYYAFKVNVLPSRVIDSGACSGCSSPVGIRLREIQLFQPPDNNFDPVIVNPLARAEAFWQSKVSLPDPPVVTSFEPRSGKVGDAVVLRGTNLASVTRVRFNRIEASFEIVSDTEITTRVPDGAADGIIVAEGPGGYGSTPEPFDVAIALQPPVISTVTLPVGAPGDVVVITGLHFREVTSVQVGEMEAEFVVNSPTSISMTVPEDALTGRIRVETTAGSATSAEDFIVAPVITSVQPAQGTPGTTVSIRGRNFTYVHALAFGDTPAPFVIRNPSHITTTVPNGARTGVIAITSPGGTFATPTEFVVLDARAPRIDSFDPTGGYPGDPVVVRGVGFANVTSVRLGIHSATFTVSSQFELRFIVPAGAYTSRIEVSTTSGVAISQNEYTIAPVVTEFTPTQGSAGTQVDIRGVNLTNVYRVLFNGTTAPVTIVSSGQILTTVPATATTGPITVSNYGGSFTTTTPFVVTSGPIVRIDRFLPRSGPPGTQVFVYGSKFLDVVSVRVGGQPASFSVASDSELSLTVPQGAGTGRIRVTAQDGSFAETASDFEVLEPPPSGGGINLSWDDCGTAGVRTKTFACDTNAGAPFTLVGSFMPPSGVTDFLGISADLTIETENALPDWWKHGVGQCRSITGLATSFDFTTGLITCRDFYEGAATGGLAYEVGFGTPNRAQLRIQGAVSINNRGPVDAQSEYYAFMVNVLPDRATGTGSCAGCDVPATITLQSIQLFQPPEKAFDPTLTLPLAGTTAYWQREPDSVPTIGPNLVSNATFEGGVGGWRPLVGSDMRHAPAGRTGAFALQAVAPDTAGEFGVTDYPNAVKPVLEAGHRYRFGAWVKAESSGLRAQLRVREYRNLVLLQSRNSTWVAPDPEWQYVELDVTATAPGSTLDLAVLSPSSTPLATLLIDDVSIRQLGTAPHMTSSEDLTVEPLQAMVIEVNADDPSGEAIRELAVDFSDLPSDHNATFTVDPDRKHGVVSWTPRLEDGGGTYTVKFRGRSLLEHSTSTRITVRQAANPYGLSINPSFEGPSLYGWNEINGAILTSTNPGRSGSFALMVQGPPRSTIGVNDSPNIISKKRSEELTRYRYTCWVRSVVGGGEARLRVREYDDSTRVATSYSREVSLTTSWRKLVIERVVTAPHSTLDFAVLCQGNPSGVMYVDDVAVFGLPAASEGERTEGELSSVITLAPPRVVPNPVRGRAMLQMTLARRGPLRVELFDVNGRRVRNVFEHDNAEPGLHQFDIGAAEQGASRLGPGIFFYRIESDGAVKKGRFVVLE